MVRFPASVTRVLEGRAGRWWPQAPLLIGLAWLAGLPLAARAADAVPGMGLQGDWQVRAAGAGDRAPLAEPGSRRDSLSLFGDYYFARPGIAPADALQGGFRATGGVFVGPRSGLGLAAPAGWPAGGLARASGLALPDSVRVPYGAGEAASVPYVGVGYSGLKALRATGGGWAFSADVGLMALQPRSAVRLGQQPVQDTLRDLQLSPMLQVGASYSF